jgi:hypothetical protein
MGRTYKWQHEAAVQYADKMIPEAKDNFRNATLSKLWCECFKAELERLKALPTPPGDSAAEGEK